MNINSDDILVYGKDWQEHKQRLPDYLLPSMDQQNRTEEHVNFILTTAIQKSVTLDPTNNC